MPHENISRCTHAASIIHDRHVPIFLLNLEISIRLLHPNLGSLASTTSLPLLAAPRFRVITFETPCAFFKASPQTLPNDALRGRTMNRRSDKDKADTARKHASGVWHGIPSFSDPAGLELSPSKRDRSSLDHRLASG